MANENTTKQNDILRRFLRAIKSSFVLIISIILIAVLAGVVFSVMKKPTYTATSIAVYGAKLSDSEDSPHDMTATKAYLDTVADFCDSGFVLERADYYYDIYLNNKSEYKDVDDFVSKMKEKEIGNTYNYNELMEKQAEMKDKTMVFVSSGYSFSGGNSSSSHQKYIGTFLGFERKRDKINKEEVEANIEVDCVVIKSLGDGEIKYLRGNKFYKDGIEISVSQLLTEPEYNKISNYSFINDFTAYENVSQKKCDNVYYNLSDISISASTYNDVDVNYAISISCKDKDKSVAVDKVKILVLAIDIESKICVPYVNAPRTEIDDYTVLSSYKYFGVRVSLSDLGIKGVESNVSTTKIILIFFLCGVVLALLAVYIKSLFDRTIKSKEELENITGTNCLSYINKENNEGGKK